jgi:TonB family protein
MRFPRTILPWLVLAIPAMHTSLALAQESVKPLPQVIAHERPVYPPLALQARITGDVRVKVTTSGESVVAAEAENGHALLREAAEKNVRTWKFAAHEPGTFVVTFRYRFRIRDAVDVSFLESPALVDLSAEPPIITDAYPAGLDFGTWKAQLKSTGATSQQVFMLVRVGLDDQSIAGAVKNSENGDEVISGDRRGDLLGFIVKIKHGNRSPRQFFRIGNLSGNRIRGTFIDETGSTGTWSAVREEQ